jgi:Uma2 family endonuclease
MTADEFLVWSLDQEGRWELVRGIPVLAMAGAKRRHDDIVVNIIAALRVRLRGKPCSPQTSDQALRTGPFGVRRPDATVDCGRANDDALESTRPTAAFEVLSPTTRDKDLRDKLEEYKAVVSLRHIVLINPDRPFVLHHFRAGEASWTGLEVEGLYRALDLAAIGVELPLDEIY